MLCQECGGQYEERKDTYTMDYGKEIGKITVTGYLYFKCTKCGAVLLSPVICKALDEELSKKVTAVKSYKRARHGNTNKTVKVNHYYKFKNKEGSKNET